MLRESECMPINAAIVVPLAPLRDFAAHEDQLLARLGEHVAKQQPQVGILLPLIARHLP